MPSYFVVQPNGLLARFSTVVDDFTHMNMSETEAIETVAEEYAERANREAVQAVDRAKELSEIRWRDCLSTISSIHGNETTAERLRFLEPNGEPEPANPPSSGVSDAPGWTPGPWISGHQTDRAQTPAGYRLLYLPILMPRSQPFDDATYEANITVAAAAPDLYAALNKWARSQGWTADKRTHHFVGDLGPIGMPHTAEWCDACEILDALLKAEGALPRFQATEPEASTGSQEAD